MDKKGINVVNIKTKNRILTASMAVVFSAGLIVLVFCIGVIIIAR